MISKDRSEKNQPQINQHLIYLMTTAKKMVCSCSHRPHFFKIFSMYANSKIYLYSHILIFFLFFSLSPQQFALSIIYGLMNILSYVALRNISASLFTICAQLKILTTATFSCTLLNRTYSMVKWRALLTLSIGVLIFSEHIWNDPNARLSSGEGSNVVLGTIAVLTEVTLSGFASIYFEKVIKTDVEQLNIWERNFQLAFGSFPVYLTFICINGGDQAGFFGGWSSVTFILALLGASGGLLVALSIKYGDAILKTLATTGAIVLSSVLDHIWLGGPLTPVMMLAGCIVVLAIFDYTFDPSPAVQHTIVTTPSTPKSSRPASEDEEEANLVDHGAEKDN